MAPPIFTFTSATRGRIHGHKVVEYRLREGHSGVVHSVSPLLLDRLETTKVANPYTGSERYHVIAHYKGPQGAYETAFYVNDPSILRLISDIREENGMSRL